MKDNLSIFCYFVGSFVVVSTFLVCQFLCSETFSIFLGSHDVDDFCPSSIDVTRSYIGVSILINGYSRVTEVRRRPFRGVKGRNSANRKCKLRDR